MVVLERWKTIKPRPAFQITHTTNKGFIMRYKRRTNSATDKNSCLRTCQLILQVIYMFTLYIDEIEMDEIIENGFIDATEARLKTS